VAAGSFHTVVLTQQGEVFSWGCGRDGQLGHGDWGSPRVPHLVKALQGKDVIQVGCGEYHSAALTSSGELYTWGDGGDGQLGHGDWRTKGFRLAQPRLVKALAGKGVTSLSCGEYHTAVLSADGTVYTWGKSVNGQLGNTDDIKKVTLPAAVEGLEPIRAISCGGAHTVALTSSGDVWQWGDPISGQLGLVSNGPVRYPSKVEELSGTNVVDVACGSFHSSAVTANGELYTWGHGGEGRLGHGDEANQSKPKTVRALGAMPVVQVSCGRFHTTAFVGDAPGASAPISRPAVKESIAPNSSSRRTPGRTRPTDQMLDAVHVDNVEAENDRLRAELAMAHSVPPIPMVAGPGPYSSPRDESGLRARLAAVEAELQQAYRERDMYAQRGTVGAVSPGVPMGAAQVEQERETHSAQVAELELSLARKKAECEVILSERNKLQEECDKWRKEKEALDIALKNVTDNFAATAASMSEGHRQRENDLEDRLKEAIDASTKGNPKALREMNELRKQLEFTTQELEKERLAREAAEKTCRELRAELMSAKEEVDRMWEEIHNTRETHGKIVGDLEHKLASAVEGKDGAMESATKSQEERLRHFEDVIMEKAKQEREELARAHMELEQQLAHAVAEKNTLEKQSSHLMLDLEKARAAKEEQDSLITELRTQVLEAQAQRESILKSMGDLETSLQASKLERNEAAAVAKGEKETLGSILRDLEEQLSEAKLVRMEITDQTRADKDVLARALENLEGRLTSMHDEKSDVQNSAKEDISRMTAALRDKEEEIVALEKAKRAVEKQLADLQLELSSTKVGYDTMSKELQASEMRYEQTAERLDELLRHERELELQLQDTEHLKEEREKLVERLKGDQGDEMRRVGDERDRMQREFNLEMERSRADKEFFRSEISFHKKTVAGLTAEKEIMMKQAKHDKEVLTQAIQDLENQLAEFAQSKAEIMERTKDEMERLETKLAELEQRLRQAQKEKVDDEIAAKEEIERLNEQLHLLEDAYYKADREKRQTIERTQREMEAMNEELRELEGQLTEAVLGRDAAMTESKESLSFIMHELRTLRGELTQTKAGREEVMTQAKGKQLALVQAKADMEFLSTELKDLMNQLVRARAEKEEIWSQARHDKETLGTILKDSENRVVEAQMERERDVSGSVRQVETLKSEVLELDKMLKAAQERERGLLQRVQMLEGRVELSEADRERYLGLVREGIEAEKGEVLTLKELLNQAKAEKMQVWQQAREDKELLTRQVEELQNVMATLKKEKEEHYRESRRDKEVMERILSDLETSFTRMQEEREDSLHQAKSSTELLSSELSRLHDQLEQTRGDQETTASQGNSDREMLGRLVKDLEEQLGSALKAKLQGDMMIQAQKASHDKEVDKIHSQLDTFRAEYGELKEQSRAEKEVLGRMIKDMEDQCANAIREKGHLESLLSQATGSRSDMELAREEYKSMLAEMTQEKQEQINKLRDDKDYLSRQLKDLSDAGSASESKIGVLQDENTQLKATQLQLSDLRTEHQALARDYAAMEAELATANAKVVALEQQIVDGGSSLTEQVNELKYQLVHAKADKEEATTKAEHDKAKMYGILKELEQQLREATGGDPSSNLMAKMSEFTDTMGVAAPSSGALSAALQEYKEKLDLAQQENTSLRAQLNASR
jgi:chromosome segregation ATPase